MYIFGVLLIIQLVHAQLNPDECGRRPLGASLLNKIVGGKVSIKGDWGWQVSIHRNGRHQCGGTLLDNYWVLTAAHCFDDSENPRSHSVIVGSHEREPMDFLFFSSGKHKVKHIILHEGYNTDTIKQDIALVKLETPVTFSNTVIPACIQTASTDLTNKIAFATGWGSTRADGTGSLSKLKQEVSMPILSNNECSRKFSSTINSAQQFCAGKSGEGKDTCQGDSGGPLVIQNPSNKLWYVVGVTSYGDGCEDGGVYTRVSYYIRWMKSVFQAYPNY